MVEALFYLGFNSVIYSASGVVALYWVWSPTV
jgi:hypothetical protein